MAHGHPGMWLGRRLVLVGLVLVGLVLVLVGLVLELGLVRLKLLSG